MGQLLKLWLSLWSLLLKAEAAQAKKHCLLPGKKGGPSAGGKEGDGEGTSAPTGCFSYISLWASETHI